MAPTTEPEEVTGVLDDAAAVKRHDPDGMLEKVESAADQWRGMMEAASQPPSEKKWRSVRDVVVAGMGGSAIAGDMVGSLLRNRWPVRIDVVRGYDLPAWVNESTLVVCCSYSGNTEETLAVWHEAGRRDAMRAAITTGGTIGEEARQQGVPTVVLPDGFPPRSALPSSLVALLRLLGGVGPLTPGGPGSDESEGEIEAVATTLERLRERCGRQVPTTDNPAKQLAVWFDLALPVIYAPEDPLGAVAVRWRGQFAENAKRLAWGHALPEMNHNEIVGWEAQRALHPAMRVLFLEDRDQGPRLDLRIQTTSALIAEAGVGVRRLLGEGNSLLSRMMHLVALGDYTSVYLAVGWGIDPTPVLKIDHLKARLSEASP